MSSAEASFAAVALMATTTYLTRVAGVWIVSAAPDSKRLERFLQHLSGSILAALVVPAAIGGDPARFLGVAAAAVAMLATRHALLSLALGVALTAIVRLQP